MFKLRNIPVMINIVALAQIFKIVPIPQIALQFRLAHCVRLNISISSWHQEGVTVSGWHSPW